MTTSHDAGREAALARLAEMADHGRIDAAYGNFSHPALTMIADVRKVLPALTRPPAQAGAAAVEGVVAVADRLAKRMGAEFVPATPAALGEIPGGMVLVPVTPTEDMLHAAYLCGDGGSPKSVYDAMIRAALPTLPTHDPDATDCDGPAGGGKPALAITTPKASAETGGTGEWRCKGCGWLGSDAIGMDHPQNGCDTELMRFHPALSAAPSAPAIE